jgi:8-oxo-dGTP diphosphatase
VGALIFRRNSILLVERAGNPLKGYWSLPGGLLETGETLEVKFYGLFQRIMRDAMGRAEYHYLLADYVCRVIGGALQPGDDVSRVEFVPRSRLKDYTMTEGTLAVIEEAYALRKRS